MPEVSFSRQAPGHARAPLRTRAAPGRPPNPWTPSPAGFPFYLAHPELAELHAQKTGHIEGENRKAVLRYLRHELGHVVNYAFQLYDEGEWVRLFGTITQPYLEEYRPSPFSRRYVRHLPGVVRTKAS